MQTFNEIVFTDYLNNNSHLQMCHFLYTSPCFISATLYNSNKVLTVGNSSDKNTVGFVLLEYLKPSGKTKADINVTKIFESACLLNNFM